MKTFSARPQDVRQEWVLIDASDKVLGRLATEIARRLRGKHKAEYTPHVDTGDHVVVVNAGKIRVTGNKDAGKVYFHHTGYPGGIKETAYSDLKRTAPQQVIEKAVRGMLPKNRLGRAMFKKLHVYAGSEHRHEAQQPKSLEL